MAGLDELNRFECPGPSAPFASADVAISDLVVANLLMYSLTVMILLYLATPFFTLKVFWMRYHHFCKDKYSIVTQIKHK